MGSSERKKRLTKCILGQGLWFRGWARFSHNVLRVETTNVFSLERLEVIERKKYWKEEAITNEPKSFYKVRNAVASTGWSRLIFFELASRFSIYLDFSLPLGSNYRPRRKMSQIQIWKWTDVWAIFHQSSELFDGFEISVWDSPISQASCVVKH